MAVGIGIDGGLAVSSGTQLEHLFDTGGVGGYRFTLNTNAPEFDTTAFAASQVVGSNTVGIPQWSVNFSGRFPKAGPQTGSEGLVTWASGYALHCKGWNLALRYDTIDTTEFASTPPSWLSFVPGLLRWSGGFDAGVSDTTDVVLPSATAATSATFRITEDGATDRTFEGDITAVQTALTVEAGSSTTSRVPYTFTGSGDLTVAGTNNVLPSGTVPRADAGTVVFTVASGKTHTGSCFLSQLNINCAFGSLLDVSGTLQGSGALTLA